MKTLKLFFIILFLIPISIKGFTKEIKGPGIIKFECYNTPTISFYETIDSKNPIHSIEIYNDQKLNGLEIKTTEKNTLNWLKPLHKDLDYDILHFQCSQIKGNWYQIVVNEETNLKYWIKKSNDFVYVAWEKYILDNFGIFPIDPENNPILIEPDEKSEKTKTQPINYLIATETHGDWLKVKFDFEFCEDEKILKENENFEGFIHWKKGTKLLIKYYLLL